MESIKKIAGYEGYYVSTSGVVFSSKSGQKRQLQQVIGNGYKCVFLYGEKRKKCYVHRLVADAFIGNSAGYDVNHIDGVKTNNNVGNLEIVTHHQNIEHAIKAGLIVYKKGEENQCSVLKTEEVREIKRKYEEGNTSFRKLAKEYGVNKNTVSKIVKKQTWAWL